MNKTVLLVCASFVNPSEIFWQNVDKVHREACSVQDESSLGEIYARINEVRAGTIEIDLLHIHALLLQKEFDEACGSLLQHFIESEQKILILISRNNAKFIAFWRLVCVGRGLALRVAHIRDFSLLYSNNPEIAMNEFLTAVYVLKQLGSDVAHFENFDRDRSPAELANLWKIFIGDYNAYECNAIAPVRHHIHKEFAHLPAECKSLIRLFDDMPMGKKLSGINEDMLAGFVFACRKDSALQMYISSARHDSQAQYTEKLLSKLSAIEKELSARIISQAKLTAFLHLLKSEVESKPRNAEAALLWLETQLKNFDANNFIHNKINQISSVSVCHKIQRECGGAWSPKISSSLRLGAADHVRRLPAYRFGEILVSKSRSFTGCLSMPVELIKQYRIQLQEKKDRGGAPLPVLADFADAHEGRELCKTVTFKLGKAFIDNITSPIGWLRLPFALKKALAERHLPSSDH